MKKISLLMILIALVFTGCKKDDNTPSNNNAEIQGSAWSKDESVFKDETLGLGIDGKGNYSYKTTTSNPEFRSYKLRYIYIKPNIEIKFGDGSNFGSGYIEGAKMNLGNKGTYTRYR